MWYCGFFFIVSACFLCLWLHLSHRHHRSIPSSSPTRENHSHLQYSGVLHNQCLISMIIIVFDVYYKMCWHVERVTISRFSILGVLAIVSCNHLPTTWVAKWGRVGFTHYVDACPPAVNFADQLLSIATTLPQDYNIYGLGEHKTQLKLKYVFLKSDNWFWWGIKFDVIYTTHVLCIL